jgi:hypothetical protein
MCGGSVGRTAGRARRHGSATGLVLALSAALLAPMSPATAQDAGDLAPVVYRAVASGPGDGERRPVLKVQMPGMPGMMGPAQGGSQGSMGGGMTMVMTGDTAVEMMSGACTAGLFIGGIAVAVAGPVSLPAVAGSAGVGCGFAMAATAAGMVGMMAGRTVYAWFK